MNGYVAFYKGKQMDIYAETSFAAQEDAAKKFKAKKSYEVSVVLAETDVAMKDGKPVGTQVVHAPLF